MPLGPSNHRSPHLADPRWSSGANMGTRSMTLDFSEPLCRPAHAFAKQILNQPYKAVRIEWLKPENHIQPLVGGLGIRKTAQHDDGYRISAPTQLSNEFRSAHNRHEVI